MAQVNTLKVRVSREPHRHAARRQFRRKVLQVTLFFIIIVTATYLLKILFSFSTAYNPQVYEPKDLDREKLLKKLDQVIGTPGQAPEPPQRGPAH